MFNNLKNIAVVSLSTVGSRVLGLLRDILIFAALGASLWNSAFILAFTIPNLFRRLLGEGALTSAVVPVFSDVMERDGRQRAFDFLNQVLLRLAVFLLVFVALGMLLLYLLFDSDLLPQNWELCTRLTVLLLPYMLFICLAAIVSAGLNLVGRFAVAAATPILLNLSMISAAGLGLWLGESTAETVYWLCGGVLLGGLLQLLFPAWDLWRQGWRPSIFPRVHAELGELWQLFLPGLLGAAILQVNIIVSRLLAYTLDDASVSVLFLASRLMELPLGIFTIAVATVFFPLLAQAVSNKDRSGFATSLSQGMRLVVGVSFPAGVGLCILGPQILSLLFEWGAFDSGDVAATVPIVAIYGLGLPFYSAATFCTRGLHAQKQMKVPVRIAGICLLVNVFCGLVFMQFWGASGLALANVVAAVVQTLLLWRALAAAQQGISFARLRPAFVKILIAGLAMGLFCAAAAGMIGQLGFDGKIYSLSVVLLLVPGGALLYFGVLYLLRFEEMDGLKRLLRRFTSAQR